MMINLKKSIAAQKKEYEHTDPQYLIILKKLFDLSLFGERFDLKDVDCLMIAETVELLI